MTTQEKLIRRKMGLLELAGVLGNVSQACKIQGYSRDSFYRLSKVFEEKGVEGLKEISRRKPNHRNRIAPETEGLILRLSMEFPAFGQVRMANELLKHGVSMSAAGVRGVWQRHDLETIPKRLKALEAKVAAEGGPLTESQIQALEKLKEEREYNGEIETEHPGYLGCQDSMYVGHLKGVGRIYQQTFLDTFSRVALCKLYPTRTALTAADHLNDRVIPFFESEGLPLLRILTDRGSEYCGNIERHEYQLFLALNEIDHSRTKAYSPQTNGIAERFHKTIQDEFYKIAFRKKIYTSIDELQRDLDTWLDEYNYTRPHQGKRCEGRTPAATFEAGKELVAQKTVSA